MALEFVRNLYKVEPQRGGDVLLEPQRWCHWKWSQITTSVDSTSHPLFQIARRVVQLILLILPTLVSYALGLVGILIKIATPVPPPSFPLYQSDPQIPKPNAHLQDIEAKGSQVVCSSPSNFPYISDALFIYIFSFLEKKEIVVAMQVCCAFNRLAKTNPLWTPVLEEERIWGGSWKWHFGYNRNSLGLEYIPPPESLNFPAAYEQIKTYHTITPPFPEAINYLARLMKGGPVAFSRLPRLNSHRLFGRILTEHITAPIMYGCSEGDYPTRILALRIQQNGQNGFSTIILKNYWNIFKEHIWTSEGNLKIPQTVLNGLGKTDAQCLNYFLRLMNREPLGEVPAGCPSNICLEQTG